jgi:hypothetical protein
MYSLLSLARLMHNFTISTDIKSTIWTSIHRYKHSTLPNKVNIDFNAHTQLEGSLHRTHNSLMSILELLDIFCR